MESVKITESEDIDFGVQFNHILMDESRKLLLLCTSDLNSPGSILCAMASPQLETRYVLIFALCYFVII